MRPSPAPCVWRKKGMVPSRCQLNDDSWAKQGLHTDIGNSKGTGENKAKDETLDGMRGISTIVRERGS
jgi:hypothetical protein